jgi:undecaprenyl-diphosphatase
VEFKDVLDQNIAGADWIPLIVGVISAAVSSYWAIAWLLDFLKKQNTWIFIWYRLAFGLFLLFGVSQKWRGF